LIKQKESAEKEIEIKAIELAKTLTEKALQNSFGEKEKSTSVDTAVKYLERLNDKKSR